MKKLRKIKGLYRTKECKGKYTYEMNKVPCGMDLYEWIRGLSSGHRRGRSPGTSEKGRRSPWRRNAGDTRWERVSSITRGKQPRKRSNKEVDLIFMKLLFFKYNNKLHKIIVWISVSCLLSIVIFVHKRTPCWIFSYHFSILDNILFLIYL